MSSLSVKAADAEVGLQREIEKLHAAATKSIFEVKMYTTQIRSILRFGCRKLHVAVRKAHYEILEHFMSSDVEMHAAVARSTCASETVQNTWVRSTFLNFRCRKISQLASLSVDQSVR